MLIDGICFITIVDFKMVGTKPGSNGLIALFLCFFPPLHCLLGVHTSDIITVYISAIKALRHLDPSMVILQVACQPIRKYLR